MLHRQARLFYRKAWQPAPASFCHVGIRLQIHIQTRSFNAAPIGGLPFLKWADPRQCIVDTDNPLGTTKGDVLARLSNFWPPGPEGRENFRRRQSRSLSYNEAVVILATPSFARWLQDDTQFIPGVLHHLVPRDNPPCDNPAKDEGAIPLEAENPASDFDVDVFCACVDGLPPDLEWIKTRNATYTREGFAFLHGRANHILPNLWEAESSSQAEDGGLLQLPTPSGITFASCQEQIPPNPLTEAVVPPANTLFVNGKESTMFASRWRLNEDSLAYQKVEIKEKKHQVINVFKPQVNNVYGRKVKTGFRLGHIPTIPLTIPRQIKSGLGNIIRELVFEKGFAGAASEELEANFDEYMSMRDNGDARPGIWALITPSKHLAQSPSDLDTCCLTTKEGVKSFWGKSRYDTRFIGAWLNRRATLSRIVSGGGGWGIGGGLLSLDPQITPEWSELDQFDSQDESDNPLATNGLAEPGSYVQFFIAPKETAPTVPEPPTKTTDGPGGQYLLTAVGSMPKKLDSEPEANHQADEVGSTVLQGTNIRPGIFGAVSESGFFVRTCGVQGELPKEEKTWVLYNSVRSKIDYPHAYVYQKFKDARIEAPKEVNKTQDHPDRPSHDLPVEEQPRVD